MSLALAPDVVQETRPAVSVRYPRAIPDSNCPLGYSSSPGVAGRLCPDGDRHDADDQVMFSIVGNDGLPWYCPGLDFSSRKYTRSGSFSR
jgi:hypothetical protein